MKAVSFITKSTEFFQQCAPALGLLGYSARCEFNSILVTKTGCEDSLIVFDRSRGDNFFEKFHLPSEASSLGYKYGYLVEFENTDWLCKVARDLETQFDFLVCDNDGQVFVPSHLVSNKLSLQ